jgi:hypothetical protein
MVKISAILTCAEDIPAEALGRAIVSVKDSSKNRLKIQFFMPL